MDTDKKRFLTAVSVLIGTAIGAGVLGIPYVAAKSGFFVGVAYILLLGVIMTIVNLYYGEIVLRTNGEHQIAGYARKYLGKKGKIALEFAIIFGVYSAIIAYTLGIGESISFLLFQNTSHFLLFGILFGAFMSAILWRGIRALKKFEKIGVLAILILLAAIILIFAKDISSENLYTFNPQFIFLPFGVVLFALMSYNSVPEVNIILKNDKHLMKKTILTGMTVCVIFYILFSFVVVGVKGQETPEIATLALGKIFVFLGILTMFTSYLALGNALIENFMYDERFRKKEAWFFTAVIPLIIFVFIESFEFFSFTKILSIGGVVSGGLTAVLILLMVLKAKKNGNRKPPYSLPANWLVLGVLSIIFFIGIIIELKNLLF